MLRDTIIFTVKNLKINLITAIIFESMPYHFPGITFIMIDQALDILKDEYFRFTFLDYPGEFTEQRSPRILETLSFSDHRECLTRRTTYKDVNLALKWSCIKCMDISVPPALVNIIVGKIRFLTFFINIAGKYDFCIQA